MIGGSNKVVNLYSKEGMKLMSIGEPSDSWVWSCKSCPNRQTVAISYNDGTLAYYQTVLSTVHGLYKDRYVIVSNPYIHVRVIFIAMYL